MRVKRLPTALRAAPQPKLFDIETDIPKKAAQALVSGVTLTWAERSILEDFGRKPTHHSKGEFHIFWRICRKCGVRP